MENKTLYIPPQIEEVEFQNESGFAVSGNSPESYTGGSSNDAW